MGSILQSCELADITSGVLSVIEMDQCTSTHFIFPPIFVFQLPTIVMGGTTRKSEIYAL